MKTRAIQALVASASLVIISACVEQPMTGPEPTVSPNFSRAPDNPAPIHRASKRDKGKADEYIVVLNDGVLADVVEQRNGVKSKRKFNRVLNAFAAKLTPADLKKLEGDIDVKYIQEDVVPTLSVIPNAAASAPAAALVQSGATWGIDRVDQRDLPLDGSYNYTNNGTGVNVYVIDSGILTTHTEFASGRAKAGVNGYDAFGGNGQDCYGHGTHVAGTVGGATYGVAKKVTMYSVRIYDCYGGGAGLAELLAAFDWIIEHSQLSTRPAITQNSWGYWDIVPVIDDAFVAMNAAGIVNVVAAGNQYGADACLASPARVASNITVAASNQADWWAGFSNAGPCIDIIAPGEWITSAWISSTTGMNVMSGTSMATPHVTGVIAQYLQRHKNATPAQAREALLDVATYNRISGVPTGTKNYFLHRLNGTVSGATVVTPHGGYYCTTQTGTHTAHLTGPAGTNYDLALQRWNGSAWVTMQSKSGLSSSEAISFNNTSNTGTQYWRYVVTPVSGSGTFDLYVRRPNGPNMWDAATSTICT